MYRQSMFACGCLAMLIAFGCSAGDTPEPPAEIRELDTTVDPPEVDLGTPTDEVTPTDETKTEAPAANQGNKTSATLRGRFVYDGTPPTAAILTPTKDAEVCGKHTLSDETLVVSPDGGIANVFVWVRTKGKPAPAPEAEKVVLDNNGCLFEPHATVLHVDQTLVVKNSDPVGHNANIASSIQARNFAVGANSEVEDRLEKPERLPVKVSCGIHPWMGGWLFVTDTFATTTGADGSFEITGLPLGEELEFQLWQEKAGYVSKVTQDGKDPDWKRGRFTQTFSGDVDLGEIKVSAEAFN